MQQIFVQSFTPKCRSSIRVLTLILNIEAEESSHFLPWDIIDDLQGYIIDSSFIRFLDGSDTPEKELYNLTSVLTYTSNATSIRLPYHLFVMVPQDLTPIPTHFLFSRTSLVSIDVSGFNGVTSLGDYFMANCVSLKSFDTSGLEGVSVIGQHFVSHCTSLTSF
eukprot:PhF_6_TR20856/c0_g2_i2/m.30063